MHCRGTKPQWACHGTRGPTGNKSPLCDQREISAEAWAWSNGWNSFASHMKWQALSFSPRVCKSLWSVKTLINSFFINHYCIHEICSKRSELPDHSFVLLLLPSGSTGCLHCYCTHLCPVPLQLVLLKSKLDKAVITCFYLDSFNSGSVIFDKSI